MNISGGLLCNLFGEEIENGELPNDIEWTRKSNTGYLLQQCKKLF